MRAPPHGPPWPSWRRGPPLCTPKRSPVGLEVPRGASQPALGRPQNGDTRTFDQALAEFQFEEYVSKSTGETYPGGKVERELEEVSETLDDFFELAAGRLAPKRED